jgi:hypothetical protein
MDTRTIDDWQINIRDESFGELPIVAVASHDAQAGHAARGRDLKSALLALARLIHVDRQQLLSLFEVDQ